MTRLKKKLSLDLWVISLLLLAISCESKNNNPFVLTPKEIGHTGQVGTIYDIDSNKYKIIGIGSQIWMAENLRVTRLNNGTPIPHIADGTKWYWAYKPGYCWYNNDSILNKQTSSGLKLIQADRYAFKDLNRNNLLDQFEDWRVDFETRAASIVKEIPIDQMMGMKMNPFGIGSVNADALDDDIRNRLEIGYRQLRAPGSTTSGKVKASWNNMVQEYIETLDDIVCIPAVWIADPRSGDVSDWPGNFAFGLNWSGMIKDDRTAKYDLVNKY